MARRLPYLLTKQEVSVLLKRINLLNIPSKQLQEFYRFDVKNELMGYCRPSFVNALKAYCSTIYEIDEVAKSVSFLPHVEQLTADQKTAVLRDCNQLLRERGLIKGWRNEYLPVSTKYGGEPLYLLERALIPYFGIKAYGVHLNGFVRDVNTHEITHLWVGRRSKTKATWPGMLDHVVAGGQPAGISLLENVIKECAEEANIPRELAGKAKSVGAVSYNALDEENNLKRDVLFCYDLELPRDFEPTPMDNEVESFECHTIEWVIEKLIYESRDEYKPNCNLVLIDFMLRHGFIDPESPNYLELLVSLRQGDCK